MKLTAENVGIVFTDCLFKDEETTENHIKGEGVIIQVEFHPDRLSSHETDIISMLSDLPEQFKESGGGGWSFLNACMDKEGNQWGEHSNIDQLLALGTAIRKVKFQMPRDMWTMLPGGMPYFSVKV